jgi:hypothetical protein
MPPSATGTFRHTCLGVSLPNVTQTAVLSYLFFFFFFSSGHSLFVYLQGCGVNVLLQRNGFGQESSYRCQTRGADDWRVGHGPATSEIVKMKSDEATV